MRKWGAVLGVIIWLGGVAQAEPVDRLYEVTIPVQGQDALSREAAITAAFKQVLVKVSGVRDNKIKTESVQQYVAQYRYERLGETETKGLWVKFDQAGVDRLLLDQGLRVWASRPSLLVWLAVDDGGHRYLAEDEAYASAIKKISDRRGLSFLLPLLDIEDQKKVQFSDIWGDYEEVIQAASVRYDPDGVLVGRLQKTGNTWATRWTLYVGDAPVRWTVKGNVISAVIEQSVDQGVDNIVQQAAAVVPVAPSEQAVGYPRVVVTDIRSLADYSRVMSYLTELPPVQRIYPISIVDDNVTFEIDLSGEMARLIRLVEVGGVMAYLPGEGSLTTFGFVP